MSKAKRPAEADKMQPQEYNASPGNNSPSVTPKDISPDAASAKDVIERKLCSEDVEEQEEELLDDAVELTFPASDPIAISSPQTLEKHRASRNR